MSSPTCSVTRSTSRRASSSGVKWRPAVGAAAEPGLARVDRLVALGVVQRLGDVRRQRRLARAARRPAEGASGPRRAARGARPARVARPRRRRRVGRASASQTPFASSGSSSRISASPPLARRSARRAGTTRVSFTTTSSSAELVGQVGERAVADGAGRAVVDEQPRRVAPLGRDAARSARAAARSRARETSIRRHPTLASPPGRGRSGSRAGEGADRGGGRPAARRPPSVDAALERVARRRSRRSPQAAAELEATLPERVGDAVHEGLRAEALPVARQLAEMRGLLNQAIRRLERLEGDLLAERHARVDDLALLVDLVSSGWEGVEQRLERLEATARPAAPSSSSAPASPLRRAGWRRMPSPTARP